MTVGYPSNCPNCGGTNIVPASESKVIWECTDCTYKWVG